MTIVEVVIIIMITMIITTIEDREKRKEGRCFVSVYIRVRVGVKMKYLPLAFFFLSNLVSEDALKNAGVPIGGPIEEKNEDDGASNVSSCIGGEGEEVRG